ncbi:MAG: TonB-dependent siderophore receptor [Lautropia sp.]|nr:TonB-dependent siderophore receptor [Lautropia sp.]
MALPPSGFPLSRSLVRSGMLLSLLAAAPMAQAQQADATLGDVVVVGRVKTDKTEKSNSYTTSLMSTTTGLDLSPRETPQSVSVVTRKQMKDQGINRLSDALKQTTGITVLEDSTRTRFQSRGFYIDQIEEDGVASQVPGSASNPYRTSSMLTDMVVYDHVEVLRGAAGLTQANGEPGGTINVVRKKPTAKLQASAQASAARWDDYRLEGDVSGPLTAGRSVRGRLVAAGEKSASFKDVVDNDLGVVYGVVDADVGEAGLVTAGVVYQRIRDVPDPFGVPMGVGVTELGLPRSTYLGADWNRTLNTKVNPFVEFDYYLNDDWKFNSKLNLIDTRMDQRFAALANGSRSFTGVAADGLLTGNNMQYYDNDSKELAWQGRATGKYELLGRSHDLFVTLSLSRQEEDSHWRRVLAGKAYSVWNFDHSALVQPNWNDQSALDLDADFHNEVKQRGLSLGTRLNLSDAWHLLVGARYAGVKSSGSYYYRRFNGKADNDYGVNRAVDKKKVTPYAGLTWDFSPGTSAYASWTEIFKVQSNVDAANNVLDPVVGHNVEVGTKSSFLDDRLNLSFAVFQITQKNRAVSVLGTRYSVAEGKVRSRGFEVEASGELTPDWNVFAGYTFNNSKYLETESTVYAAGENYSKHTPKHMLRAYSSYRLPGELRPWSVGAGFSVQSKTNSLGGVPQGGFTLWNANVHYDINRNYRVSVVGKNLTDKRYYVTQKVRYPGINNFFGEPRSLMLQLSWTMK